MDMSPQEYQAYIKERAPKSPIWKDTALAFLIGGAICVLGQLILDGYRSLGLDKTDAGTATSVTLIFLAALTTGLNLYNSLARFAGAGTLVPITGFANSVVSPAIDFKAEGIITGMAAKMFVIAGPVMMPSALKSMAGDRVRHARERGVRRGADADGIEKSAAGPRFSLAPHRTIFYNVAIESNNGGWHDVRKR